MRQRYPIPFERHPNGTYVSELDMVSTSTELVWTETRKEGGQPHTIAIYRTAR